MWPFTLLAGSTWGFPILAALHVAGLAWFGGLALVPGEFPRLQRGGLGFLMLTGLALFLMQPVRYVHSYAFWIKLVLIAAALAFSASRTGAHRAWLLVWFGVILAARLTAFI